MFKSTQSVKNLSYIILINLNKTKKPLLPSFEQTTIVYYKLKKKFFGINLIRILTYVGQNTLEFVWFGRNYIRSRYIKYILMKLNFYYT